MAKIHDEELKQLALVYNKEGRGHLYELLKERYEIKNPYFVFARMRNKAELGYDAERDCFCIQPVPVETDDIFMGIEELCTPVVPQRVTATVEQISGSKPEAMEKLVRELIGDRLLELSRYVIWDPLSKTMIVDKTSLVNDGYRLVTH